MSWTNELYKVYELAAVKDTDSMLPISHSTAQAQIEITISQNGEFISAAEVDKINARTIIPVTEDSAARSSGVTPMPLADKLMYISGDYSSYASGNHADNTEYFSAYIDQLGSWCKSDHSHYAIKAIYTYLSKRELIKDLVGCGLIELDETSGKFTDKKLGSISQEDAFARFIVSGDKELCYTWRDCDLYDCFTEYYRGLLESVDICYANGEFGAVTYKHPAKIRNSGDKAKLISANDSENYTYRGRFSKKEEAVSIGYDYSQKMHNALKWLIDRQSRSYDSLTLVIWNSALSFVPDITKSAFEYFDNEDEEYSTVPELSRLLHKKLMGGKSEINISSKVMIMGLDAATTGRLSIAIYTELLESEFYANLQKWHEETAWLRFNGKLKKTFPDSCSLPQIADCSYGMESKGQLNCEKNLIGKTILRLLPCVTEGARIPRDIVVTIVNKASNPLAYEKEYNHRITLENACALIRKEYKDYKKGEIDMAYDPSCTDRSYLYGCLLAIADKAEKDSYDKEKDKSRITNARRYWNAFSSRPYQTWLIIEKNLEPYLEKEAWIMTKYTRHINEIMSKMSLEDFADNTKLSPMYLIGYHHYNALLWNGNEDNKEEE